MPHLNLPFLKIDTNQIKEVHIFNAPTQPHVINENNQYHRNK